MVFRVSRERVPTQKVTLCRASLRVPLIFFVFVAVTCTSSFLEFPNTRVLDSNYSSYSVNDTLTYEADEGFHFAKSSDLTTFEHVTSGEVVCVLDRREGGTSHATAQTASWVMLTPLVAKCTPEFLKIALMVMGRPC